MNLEMGYRVLGIASTAVLTFLAICCLVRCVLGPRISDRIMAVNMISTLSIIMVGVFTVYLGEGYLADIAIIYALLSFLAVVVLCKVYTGIYRERRHAGQEQAADTETQNTGAEDLLQHGDAAVLLERQDIDRDLADGEVAQ